MQDISFRPDPTTTRAFRDALGRFPTGVTIVTTAGPDGPMGFTANSFAAVSLEPPLVLWSPARSSARFGLFVGADHYAIHVLAADQHELGMRFVRGGAGFDGLPHDLSADGIPLIPGVLARFDCRRHAVHDGGDHAIVVGEVLTCAMTQGAPLVFSQGQYARLSPLG